MTYDETRGSFRLSCEPPGTGLAASHDFVVIAATGGADTMAGLYSNFSRRLTEVAATMEALAATLAAGQPEHRD